MKIPMLMLALSVALGSSAIEVRPAAPAFADLETVATVALPVKETDSIRRVSVTVETLSSATNEFEVAFFTSSSPKPEACRLLVGLDRGRLFARGLRLDSEVSDQELQSVGSVSLSFAFELHADGGTARYEARVNGVANDFLAAQLVRLMPDARPIDWRSIKIVSRGLTDDLPMVQIDDQAKGLAIRICKR